MNWLDAILQMIGMGGNTAAQTPVREDPNAQTGLGTTPAFEKAMGGGGQSPIISALGKTDLSKFSHPQQPAQFGQLPTTTLPEFPAATQQPSLQGLMAAIQARRQRLAQLGIGG